MYNDDYCPVKSFSYGNIGDSVRDFDTVQNDCIFLVFTLFFFILISHDEQPCRLSFQSSHRFQILLFRARPDFVRTYFTHGSAGLKRDGFLLLRDVLYNKKKKR